MATQPLDRASILNQAYQLLNNQKSFSKEDSSRVENLLALADSLDGAEVRFAKMRLNAARAECGLPRDSELIRFFRKQTQEKVYFPEYRDMSTQTGAGPFGDPWSIFLSSNDNQCRRLQVSQQMLLWGAFAERPPFHLTGTDVGK